MSSINFEIKLKVSEIFEKVEYVRYPYLYTGLVCDVRNHHVTQNGSKRKTENQIRRIFLYIESGQLIFAISHFRILRIKNSLEAFPVHHHIGRGHFCGRTDFVRFFQEIFEIFNFKKTHI